MKKSFKISFLVIVLGLFFSTAFAQNPSFYISNGGSSYNVLEGNVYTFTVNLYSVSATPVVVNVNTSIGTAGNTDFTTLSTTVTILAGQLSSSSLTISTVNDAIIESYYESFTITGTVISSNTFNTTDVSYINIIDNDTTPTVTINDRTIVEGQGANMTINLSNPFSSNVNINYLTATGTANASDFTSISNSITIPAGQTSYSFYVYTTSDASTEPDENFVINITVTSGNTFNTSAVSEITIRDNDTTPTLTFGNNNSNNSEGQVIYGYVYLNRPYNSNVNVQLVTTTGTAGSTDYTAFSTTETILAGSVYVDFQINTTDDTLDEPNESFTVTGTVTSGNTTNSSATTTMTIIDNDGLPDLIISYSDDAPLVEGENGYVGIRLSQPSLLPTTVQITTSNGTAGSLDYTPLNTTITIPAGVTYYYPQLFVPTILDQLQETEETFTVTGTVTSGNTFNSSSSDVFTIQDNYAINAQPENITSVAEVGTTFQLLANDTLHGLPLNTSDATVTLVGTNTIGATINAQGVLTIPANAPIGNYYQLSYVICETLNPNSCDSTTFNVSVISPLEATYNVSYSDYNGDGYTSVGDLINYQFTITNLGNSSLTTIQVNQNFGQLTILGSPIANLNPGQSDTTTFSAYHILTQDDINYGYFTGPNQGLELFFKGFYYGYEVTDWTQQQNTFNLNTSDGIRLKVFVDSNANGIQDGTETNFPLGHFKYEINNDGVIHNLYTTPFYLYESNPTTTYNLSYEINPDYAASNSCSVSYPSITVPVGSGITTYNFPITITPYQELSVSLMSYNPPPRPGFLYSQYITYTNNSNLTLASGTVTFIKDSAVNIYSISELNAIINATGFTYNFTNLLPYETRYIHIGLQVPTIPTVSLGQLVNNSVSITIPVGDILPLNNSSSLTQTIVGSYDPNDKTEAHGGEIVHSNFTANDYLTYTIQFENTGTANAINVRVEDFLDLKLDPTSIKMINASALYSLERIENHLIWNFSGIDLPPSIADTTTGKGYLTFQVKPKTGFALGDIIPNTAEIFFDFNPAIVTNTWTTEFVPFLGVNVFENDTFEYYPNPTSDIVTFNLKNTSTTIDKIEVVDILGKTLLSKTNNYSNASIDLSSLSKGMYLVKITADGQDKTVKITKN